MASNVSSHEGERGTRDTEREEIYQGHMRNGYGKGLKGSLDKWKLRLGSVGQEMNIKKQRRGQGN